MTTRAHDWDTAAATRARRRAEAAARRSRGSLRLSSCNFPFFSGAAACIAPILCGIFPMPRHPHARRDGMGLHALHIALPRRYFPHADAGSWHHALIGHGHQKKLFPSRAENLASDREKNDLTARLHLAVKWSPAPAPRSARTSAPAWRSYTRGR